MTEHIRGATIIPERTLYRLGLPPKEARRDIKRHIEHLYLGEEWQAMKAYEGIDQRLENGDPKQRAFILDTLERYIPNWTHLAACQELQHPYFSQVLDDITERYPEDRRVFRLRLRAFSQYSNDVYYITDEYKKMRDGIKQEAWDYVNEVVGQGETVLQDRTTNKMANDVIEILPGILLRDDYRIYDIDGLKNYIRQAQELTPAEKFSFITAVSQAEEIFSRLDNYHIVDSSPDRLKISKSLNHLKDEAVFHCLDGQIHASMPSNANALLNEAYDIDRLVKNLEKLVQVDLSALRVDLDQHGLRGEMAQQCLRNIREVQRPFTNYSKGVNDEVKRNTAIYIERIINPIVNHITATCKDDIHINLSQPDVQEIGDILHTAADTDAILARDNDLERENGQLYRQRAQECYCHCVWIDTMNYHSGNTVKEAKNITHHLEELFESDYLKPQAIGEFPKIFSFVNELSNQVDQAITQTLGREDGSILPREHEALVLMGAELTKFIAHQIKPDEQIDKGILSEAYLQALERLQRYYRLLAKMYESNNKYQDAIDTYTEWIGATRELIVNSDESEITKEGYDGLLIDLVKIYHERAARFAWPGERERMWEAVIKEDLNPSYSTELPEGEEKLVRKKIMHYEEQLLCGAYQDDILLQRLVAALVIFTEDQTGDKPGLFSFKQLYHACYNIE